MYTTIPLDQIDGPAVDLRVARNDDRLRELAESIRSVGLLQPIGVVATGERYQVVFGNRRFLAHRLNGAVEVACRVLTTDEADRLSAAAAENVVREDLNPVEEARAIHAMMEGQGKSVRQVASALGKSESWVRSRRDILTWPEEFVVAVARGELAPSVARELVEVEDDGWRAVYFKAAVENGVTVGQAAMWRREYEAQRAFQGAAPPALADGPVAVPVFVPKALCHLCKYDLPITALTVVRCCAGCAAVIAAQPRGGPDGGGGGGA